ncbi:MAG: hypothetical protein Q7R83_00585 [bacterium]|nr:hypothetical protein [bacterium]
MQMPKPTYRTWWWAGWIFITLAAASHSIAILETTRLRNWGGRLDWSTWNVTAVSFAVTFVCFSLSMLCAVVTYRLRRKAYKKSIQPYVDEILAERDIRVERHD